MTWSTNKAAKVVFCVPTLTRPYQQCLDSLAASIPLIHAAGWDEGMANEVGNPYISRAREAMLTKAMLAGADVMVFIDHDMSWEPDVLLRLIETDGDVVAGNYRFKEEPENFMGVNMADMNGHPQVRADGCVRMHCVPAGFLKITRAAVNRFTMAYKDLMYIDCGTITVDLFNHGAHNGTWFGEDFSFCRNWNAIGGEVWCVPNLNLTHWHEETPFLGNYHKWLLRQPGGSASANPVALELVPQHRRVVA